MTGNMLKLCNILAFNDLKLSWYLTIYQFSNCMELFSTLQSNTKKILLLQNMKKHVKYIVLTPVVWMAFGRLVPPPGNCKIEYNCRHVNCLKFIHCYELRVHLLGRLLLVDTVYTLLSKRDNVMNYTLF